MRDQTKVIIGFGSIWGLYVFGAGVFNFLFIGFAGTNDSIPELTALVLYGLTLLPACILAIWFRKVAAIWLIILSAIMAFGGTYQLIAQASSHKAQMIENGLTYFVIAGIPALLGTLLLKSERS